MAKGNAISKLDTELINLRNDNQRLQAENERLKEIIDLIEHYFDIRAREPQVAGEVFRHLCNKLEALK